MPRRKQDRPKRMKWEEGENSERQTSSPEGDVASAQSASGSEADDESDAENKRRKVEECESFFENTSNPGKLDRNNLSPNCATDSDIPAEENRMVSIAATESPESSIPLDFSVKKYNVLDLTSKCETNNHDGNLESSPLDLSVPRSKRPGQDFVVEDVKKSRKFIEQMSPTPKSPWGYPSMAKASGSRPDGFWDGKDSAKSIHGLEAHRRQSNDGAFTQGRPNIWQSQWLTKGSDEINKDVLKCVWCKESFQSLSELTIHMKKSPRCGVSVPRTISPVTSSSSNYPKSTSIQNSSAGKNSLNDLNLLIKETMPLPRKLVRGQDVWLGKGAEQTKQILKCMWCGQSFRSLADMTTHMRQTQHYTNIISQEQLISWKSPDDKPNENIVGNNVNPAVNAVLTCKVCDQAFSSLKELSNHMSKNAHYQEHLFKAISEGGSRRRPVREKRKKALPVKKLLEIERLQQKRPVAEQDNCKPHNISNNGGRITCEKCLIKIDASYFVEHIRTCVGRLGDEQKDKLGEETTGSDRSDDHSPVIKLERESPSPATELHIKSDDSGAVEKVEKDNKGPSVLNAIERLIEKSFDSAAKKPSVTSAFILRKMGFDENAFEPKSKTTKGMGINSRMSVSPPNDSALSRASSRDSPKFSSSEENFVHRLKARLHSSSSDDSDNGSSPRLKINHALPLSKGHKSINNRVKSKVRRARRKREHRVVGENNEKVPVVNERIDRLVPPVGGINCDDLDGEDGAGANNPVPSPCNLSAINAKSTDNDLKVEDGLFNGDKAKCDKESETGSAISEVNDEHRCDNTSDGALSADDEHFLSESDDRPSASSSSLNFKRAHKVKTRKRLAKTIRDRQRHNGSDHPASAASGVAPQSSSSTSSHNRDSSPSPPGTGVGLSRNGPPGSDHPLKQLQKLLDKTDAQLFSKRAYHNKIPANFGGVIPGSNSNSNIASSPFMASFGWAYNDAITYDSISKASFDLGLGGFTPPPAHPNLSSSAVSSRPIELTNGSVKTESPERSSSKYNINNNSSSNNNNNNNNIINSSVTNGSKDSGAKICDESPHSKFLKYSELAKQLSSK